MHKLLWLASTHARACLMAGLVCAAALQLALQDTPVALAILLTAAVPAITGSVNLALLLRLDAGRMMQVLVLGTAIFPLTVLPLLFVLPQIGSGGQVIEAGLWLLLVIFISALAGCRCRPLR